MHGRMSYGFTTLEDEAVTDAPSPITSTKDYPYKKGLFELTSCVSSISLQYQYLQGSILNQYFQQQCQQDQYQRQFKLRRWFRQHERQFSRNNSRKRTTVTKGTYEPCIVHLILTIV
ncbi:unnamed protein product [Onchocerca ochengi]|uniref:Homeobox domain-containing protein n=1 Tax=Onchocerca ochengi TaxID=42157 RepID=A0A182E383_ONCOC|nr:unnamed protein product [Onchocerca ochengi]